MADAPLSRAPCSHCGRTMPVRLDGKVKKHGPFHDRCKGSGLPPGQVSNVSEAIITVNHSPSTSMHQDDTLTSTNPSSVSPFNPGCFSRRVLKRIPKASRSRAALKLTEIISEVTTSNDRASWERLFLFPRRCLVAPRRGGHRRNLAALVNLALDEEADIIPSQSQSQPRFSREKNGSLAARVSSKLEDGDFRGAVRVASSSESICRPDSRSLDLIKEKHPSSYPDSSFPPPPDHQHPLVVSPSTVQKSVLSFPAGSAGGPDGLLPQHIKDLLSPTIGEPATALLTALTDFINLVIAGRVPSAMTAYFFGANLLGLNKADGGIRPIAIGCTLRRLSSKCVGASVSEEMESQLFPLQLGFGTRMGAEGAVHAARSFLMDMASDHLLLKVDFQNAFNSIRRDVILEKTLSKAPQVYPLAYSAYRHPSFLFFGGDIILSSEGVQQGDPLGPLLFCLGIHDLVSALQSAFRVFYLDDGTLGGPVSSIKEDLSFLECHSPQLGLTLNQSKSEIIGKHRDPVDEMLSDFPSLCCTDPDEAVVLGSPIGSTQSIDTVLQAKIDNLRLMGDRLSDLETHDALCLLRHAFSLPKLLYVLRSAPCFQSDLLSVFDAVLRSLLEVICNVKLDDSCWLQASLPINSGGLGIRSAVMLAPSAFLASAAGSTHVSQAILPPGTQSCIPSLLTKALSLWSDSACSSDPPCGLEASSQKAWDVPVVKGSFSSLIAHSQDSRGRARLLACSQKESGAWLTAPPISALGLRMSNEAVRIAIGLRLGAPICTPHSCNLCGSQIDKLGTHGLSCRRSPGRIPRHEALNSIIQQSLTAAKVPSILEPVGLSRTDNKRPDGATIIPWLRGQPLAWDVTVWDTFAVSYLHLSSAGVGQVADMAARRKIDLYRNVARSHHFVPLAFESSGVFSDHSLSFLHQLASRIRSITKDPLEYLKISQRISVCIQNFNCLSIIQCCM